MRFEISEVSTLSNVKKLVKLATNIKTFNDV